MTTVSWFLDKSAPLQPGLLATQSTAFGSSSLVSRSKNALVHDKGTGVYSSYLATKGTPMSNITIYDTDKSELGIEYARRRPAEDQTPAQIYYTKERSQTTPNENSLQSDYTLK